MKKLLTAVFILLTLVLSACAVQPQETSAPTETTSPTETTAPTQPTEATQPTEPPTQPTEPPTEPPTQPTEPELSNKEKLQQYTEITDYKLKFAYHAKLEYFMGQGWDCTVYTEPIDVKKVYANSMISKTSTNAACPQSFEEICAQYDAEFFKHSFLLLLKGHGSAEAPPSIEKILVGEPLLFNRGMIAVHDNPSFENEYYSVFVELPLKYLEYVTGDRKAGDLPKWDYENMLKEEMEPTEPPTQPTEPPTQPTEPQLADPVKIKTYSVESAYIDVLDIKGMATIDTGKFHASLQSLTENLDYHKEHEFFKSTAQFDDLYAKAAEIDFTRNYVAVVYFAGLAESKPTIEKISLVEELPFNGERLFGIYVDVRCDKDYKQFMLTDISKVKYHFLMITIPKTEIALDGILPHDAGVTVREP